MKVSEENFTFFVRSLRDGSSPPPDNSKHDYGIGNNTQILIDRVTNRHKFSLTFESTKGDTGIEDGILFWFGLVFHLNFLMSQVHVKPGKAINRVLEMTFY